MSALQQTRSRMVPVNRDPDRPASRRHPFARLVGSELALYRREPMLMFWGLVFPIGLEVIMGLAGGDKHQASLGGLRLIDVYTPIVTLFSVTLVSLSALPAALASYRDKGYLRRLSTTPVGAWRLLGAQVVIIFALAACVITTITLIANLAFSVALPREFGGWVLAILLTLFAMLSLGVLVAALAPSQRVAAAVGSVLFFPLMFFAGLWVPQAQMGSTLRSISHYTPLGAGDPAIQHALAGHWPGTVNLLVLAGYGVVLCVGAARFFRWER
jgi:ABC-2 type transport system permease protein